MVNAIAKVQVELYMGESDKEATGYSASQYI